MIFYKNRVGIEQHACALPNWEQTYAQLEPGYYLGESVLIKTKLITLYRESANISAIQTFSYDSRFRHFLIPVAGSSQIQPPTLSADGIYLLPRGEKIHSFAPAGFEMMVLSVKIGDRHVGHQDRAFIKLPLAINDYQAIHHDLVELTNRITDESIGATSPVLMTKNASAQLDDIANTLMIPDNLEGDKYRPFYSTSRFIVNVCHNQVENSPRNPPSLMDLCRLLRISRRTLQYSFEKEAGVSPSHYIRALRLSSVRRRLLAQPNLSIGKAASLYGFYNQSYFTRSYRQLFLESASDTLRRARLDSQK